MRWTASWTCGGKVALADYEGETRSGLLRRQETSLDETMHAHRADAEQACGFLAGQQALGFFV